MNLRVIEAHRFENLFQADVAMVRPGVVAPADVHPATGRINGSQGLVQNPDMGVHLRKEPVVVQMLETSVPPHGEIRAIDLQLKTVGC